MKAIIQYPVKTVLDGTEYFPMLQSGKNARILLSLIASSQFGGSGINVIPIKNIDSNTTLTDLIPIGFMLLDILTSSGSLNTISIGTSPGGNDIMSGVDCNGYYAITVDKWFSESVAQTLYISSLAWVSSVDLYFVVLNITGGAIPPVLPVANPIVVLGIDADTTLTDLIPAGYKLLAIDTNSTSLVTVSIGTTPGGDNVMSAVDCNDLATITVDRWFSKTVKQTLYITSSAWVTPVDFYFSIQKMI